MRGATSRYAAAAALAGAYRKTETPSFPLSGTATDRGIAPTTSRPPSWAVAKTAPVKTRRLSTMTARARIVAVDPNASAASSTCRARRSANGSGMIGTTIVVAARIAARVTAGEKPGGRSATIRSRSLSRRKRSASTLTSAVSSSINRGDEASNRIPSVVELTAAVRSFRPRRASRAVSADRKPRSQVASPPESASRSTGSWPSSRNAAQRFTAHVVLPTPPLPEAIANRGVVALFRYCVVLSLRQC